MGTRALIRVFDTDLKPIGGIFLQSDGYPEGIPYEMVKFLNSRKVVNGISDNHYVINGMDDLYAQITAYLKLWTSLNFILIDRKFSHFQRLVKREVNIRSLEDVYNNLHDLIIAGCVYAVRIYNSKDPAKDGEIYDASYVYDIIPDDLTIKLFQDESFTIMRYGWVKIIIYKKMYSLNKYVKMFEGYPNEYLQKFKTQEEVIHEIS